MLKIYLLIYNQKETDSIGPSYNVWFLGLCDNKSSNHDSAIQFVIVKSAQYKLFINYYIVRLLNE